MCRNRLWITTASFWALVQSLIWIGLGVAGALVYLTVIPVEQYKGPEDFLRVTFVKLYFEGPHSKLSGNYLGKFNKDFRDPDKISLMMPEYIFGMTIAYIVLNAVYFCLSYKLMSCRKAETMPEFKNLLGTVRGWSCMTLVITALDTLLFALFVSDILSLTSYVKENKATTSDPLPEEFSSITYIPVILAVVSMRLVVLWMWNLTMGLIFLINACSGKVMGVSVQPEEKPEPPRQPKPQPKPPLTPAVYHPDWARHRYSLEAVTRFGDPQDQPVQLKDPYRSFPYHSEHPFYPPPPKSRRGDWEMHNEGYVDDEQVFAEAEKQSDFEHSLKNFEQGRQKSKPPLGKPVSIPIPPPLPHPSSCNC